MLATAQTNLLDPSRLSESLGGLFAVLAVGYGLLLVFRLRGIGRRMRGGGRADGAALARSVSIEGLEAAWREGRDGRRLPAFRLKVVNLGAKTLGHLEVRIDWKDAGGRPLASEVWCPVAPHAGLPPLPPGAEAGGEWRPTALPLRRLEGWREGAVSASVGRVEAK